MSKRTNLLPDEITEAIQAQADKLGPIAFMAIEAEVYADAAFVADLVSHGQSAAADVYASRPEVAERHRLWKLNKR